MTEAIPMKTRIPMGESPAALSKRNFIKPSAWCPKPDIEFDAWCDPDNPKAIPFKDICKARVALKDKFPATPLIRSKFCVQLGLELNYKCEILNKVGSFHERAALYSLTMLTKEQKRNGVYTASNGNWAMALAYQARHFNVPITVVLPVNTPNETVEKCMEYGATVILHGKNLAEAKKQAFVLITENDKGTYINGYDHPHVIAANGSIGIEILQQLPNTDAIIIPIGGGALIAGIAVAVKKLKPSVLIYGVESAKSCSFFKAMENENPYRTEVGRSIAGSLAVPTAGFNSFHTARSLIDKMILIDDDWVARAISHLFEEEKMIVEGAGCISLGTLLSIPDLVPELKDKTVVCMLSGGNMDLYTLPRALERAKALDGRLIKLTVTLDPDDTKKQLKIFSIISNIGCNVIHSYIDKAWMEENNFQKIYLSLICETRDLEHAYTLKRVMKKIFPGICEFLEEPYSPIPTCACFPKRIY